jgi:hypothetical protein
MYSYDSILKAIEAAKRLREAAGRAALQQQGARHG